jgi:hypothetical protein
MPFTDGLHPRFSHFSYIITFFFFFFKKINIVSSFKDQEQSSYNTGQAPKYP